MNNLKLKDKIVEVRDTDNEKASPEASVIIITYNTEKKLLSQNLESLDMQTDKNFEIIIVDNSDKADVKSIVSRYSIKYIKLNKNYGLSLARNIGIKYAKGNIVIFLDDDAIPAHNFVEKHISAYREYNIYGLRGKALPRTNSIYNYFEGHYDLGNQTIPFHLGLEGNSSFIRKILIEVGGFNPELDGAGGGEGGELTYRTILKFKDINKLIYYPNAIIYHDYSNSFLKYIKKQLRHAKNINILKSYHPKLFEFIKEYKFCPKKSKTPNLFDKIKIIIILAITYSILKVQKIYGISYKLILNFKDSQNTNKK